MIDTHAHLNFKAFNKDLDKIVRRFQKKGGKYIINVGTKLDSSIKAIEISQKYPFCFASVGIHPHHANSIISLEGLAVKLQKLALQLKVVAIGETGIDYYQYKNSPPLTKKQKETQKELFLLHLRIAVKSKLPLIIHCRNAYDNLLDILKHYQSHYYPKGVFHCFEGTEKHLKIILSLGFYLGFNGKITYQRNKKLKMLVKKTPLERLLLETDSPFLTPTPYRGKRNEPSYLPSIIKTIASVKNKTENLIIQQSSKNAQLLFKRMLKYNSVRIDYLLVIPMRRRD
jgi:TatD DNase family protein